MVYNIDIPQNGITHFFFNTTVLVIVKLTEIQNTCGSHKTPRLPLRKLYFWINTGTVCIIHKLRCPLYTKLGPKNGNVPVHID